MHEADIFSYERVRNMGQTAHEFSGETRETTLGSISIRSISMSVIAFMIGRVSLIGGLSPFGMAFFAATYGKGISPIAIGTCIALGALTWSWSAAIILKLIATMVLFGILTIFTKSAKLQGTVINGVKVFVSVFLISVFPLFFNFLLYDFFISVFEATVTVMLYILLRKGTAILLEDNKRSTFTAEEVVSLAFIGALTIAGIRDIGILGVEFRSIACIFIVLILARAKGAGIGAAAGVVMGLVASITGITNYNIIGSYAFSGLLAGLLRKLSGIGVILGFITGNAILTYYVTGSTEVIIQLKDIAIASILFYMLPQKVIRRAGKIFDDRSLGLEDASEAQLRSAGTAVQKLNAFSKAVEELAVTFNNVPQPEQVPGEYDISNFFDTVAERVCKDCSLCLYCWDRKFNSTYQSMFTMLEVLERKGKLGSDDVPECFSNDSCARPKELVNSMNNLYEVYRVNHMWRKKIGESRGLVAQQLQGVSNMIAQLANEIDSENSFAGSMEDRIAKELEKNGFSIDEVSVEHNKEDRLEIVIQSRGCPGVKKCANEMESIISNATGKRMVRKGYVCSPEKAKPRCMIRFTNNEIFGVTIGIAKVNKNNNKVSGDSCTFMKLKDKKYILGLSDGMGAGESAASNSRVAIDLLEKFLDSGFDKDIAVKIINSVLVLKSAEESYATMDIAAIDLHSGQVEFVKIGSPPAYIKKRDKVEIIKGASMPAGILENLDMDISGTRVNAGDFIVMVTDGVTESDLKNDDFGDWIMNFLDQIETTNSQELADLIIEKALQNYGEKVCDDMTVLVAKLWERV